MKRSSAYFAGAMFVAACVATLTLLVLRNRDATDGAHAPGAAQSQDPSNGAVPSVLNQRNLGTAAVRPPTDDERLAGSKLVAALSNLPPVDTTSKDLQPGAIPRAPAPRSAKLSDAQKKVLQKLRWGIAKDLEFRGDADDSTVRLLASTALSAPPGIGAPDTEPASEKALRFIDEHREIFLLDNPRSELVVSTVDAEADGSSVIRFNQRFSGLEVWPGQITANTSPSGVLTVVSGTYAPTPSAIDLTSRIDRPAAVAAARRFIYPDQQPAQIEVPSAALKIFADKGRTPELAFDILIRSPSRADRVFVSANSGAVLLTVPEICHAGINVTAPDMFGQPRSINVLPTGNPLRYYHIDTSKPMYSEATGNGVIAIYDGRTAANPLSSSASATTGFDPIAVSAAFNLGRAYDFYATLFGRSSFDGRGTSLRAIVRVPDPKTGGPLANAYWDGNRQIMGFGAADTYAGATDVIGHEYTHAVVQFTAKLVYNSDSGALNESFSDIMGEALERFVHGSNDWMLGSLMREQIRSMKDPPSKQQPGSMSQYVRTTEDHGGVHINSGIPNRAFYLLAEGLTGGGVGFDSARNIFYRALATKLNSRSDFQDLRSACILSANELFGAGSAQGTKTGQAFDAVGIFDASAVVSPENLTPPSGPDSYLITYRAVNTNTYLGRREAALGDGNSVTAISTIPMDTTSRAAVSGDGGLAVFVSSTRDVVVASTNGSGATALGFPGLFNSATISADGNFFACIGRDSRTGVPLNQIIYINTKTAQTEVIDLYLPMLDGPNVTSITAVDEIDLSPDGQLALFDGFARTTLGDGTVVQAWSIFGVDLRTKAIFSLAGPIADLNIGHPSFARTSEQRIIFEADSPTASVVLAADLLRGTVVTVRQYSVVNSYFAYPRFSAADNFVVFTEQFFSSSTSSYQPVVARISLQSDRITPTGSVSSLQAQALSGVGYRRGMFAGSPTLAVSAVTSSIRSGQTGTFRISRIAGDRAISVPLTFKMLGTATPAVDYSSVALTATIPAGALSVDVPIRAIAPAGAPTRSVRLNLDPQYHYLVSSTGAEAAITITGSAGPAISAQPTSQTAAAGSTVTFSVAARDVGNASYQWFKNGVAIPGATSSTLTLRNIGAADAGSYTCVITYSGGSLTSTPATLAMPSASTLSNLSVRTTMASGQTLIVGAVVSAGAETILIRAGGPALSVFGLQGMADPRLELYGAGPNPIATNDNWESSLASSFSAVGAFAFTIGSRDAALSQRLSGSFTVQCKGTGPGVVLVEAYDTAGGTSPRLINVSARNRVGVGSDILIAGFAISGSGSKQILIRGIGPTLGQFGVGGFLTDPTIKVFDSNSRLVAENDNWASSLSSTFGAVGAFPLGSGSRDAALVVSLSAGTTYTVQVAGVNNATGEALVEIYEVP